MLSLKPEVLLAERERRYRRRPELRLQNEGDAACFVNEVGLSVLFPVQRMELPSLWEAINGSVRPVPRHHNDEALGKTWGWKDTLPAQRRIYYGKLLKNKATLLSLDLLPSFYALSPNFGGEDDYLLQYEAGRLSREGKVICDVLLGRGALPTGELRRAAHLSNRSQKYRFERAMVELQRKLIAVKVGISDAGPWHYSYVHDLFVRAYPQQVEAARFLVPRWARQAIVQRYLHTTVVSSRENLAWLFGWEQTEVDRVVEDLVDSRVAEIISVAGWDGEYVADGRPALMEIGDWQPSAEGRMPTLTGQEGEHGTQNPCFRESGQT